MMLDSSACQLLFDDPIQTEAASLLLRSRLKAVAQRLGFDAARSADIVLVAAEMASNLVKHAGGRGSLQIWQQPCEVLDLVAFDWGPGLPDPELATRDGYSSAGTLGKGLGSMRRLADVFGIYSRPAGPHDGRGWHGTVVWCRFHARKPVDPPSLQVGLFVRALSACRHNGDHVYLHEAGGRLRLLHLDGLGHGEAAASATGGLLAHVEGAPDAQSLLATVDRHLARGERGAVGLICEIDRASASACLLGIGDVTAHLCRDGRIEHIAFPPGVLGREHKRAQLRTLPWRPDSTLVSTSDGIRRGLKADAFPGLCQQHPQLIAYVLGNALARMTDDQSVCALRTQ